MIAEFASFFLFFFFFFFFSSAPYHRLQRPRSLFSLLPVVSLSLSLPSRAFFYASFSILRYACSTRPLALPLHFVVGPVLNIYFLLFRQ